METKECEHFCHKAGLASCIDCQDHPAHANLPKLELGSEDQVQIEGHIIVPKEQS